MNLVTSNAVYDWTSELYYSNTDILTIADSFNVRKVVNFRCICSGFAYNNPVEDAHYTVYNIHEGNPSIWTRIICMDVRTSDIYMREKFNATWNSWKPLTPKTAVYPFSWSNGTDHWHATGYLGDLPSHNKILGIYVDTNKINVLSCAYMPAILGDTQVHLSIYAFGDNDTYSGNVIVSYV